MYWVSLLTGFLGIAVSGSLVFSNYGYTTCTTL